MSNIEKKKTGDLTPDNLGDLFESYGEAMAAGGKPFLKFSKGDFLAGKEGELVQLGTRFKAHMDQLLVGWICWQAGVPIDRKMGLFAKGFQPPRRSELGDLEQANWERSDGEPKDPWQFTNELPLERVSDGEVFIFPASSKGGLGAIGELAKEYGKRVRQHPDDAAIIELDAGSYLHPDRSIGRVKYPILRIVGWENKDGNGSASGDTPKAPLSGTPTPPSTAAKSATTKPATAKSAAAAQPRF